MKKFLPYIVIGGAVVFYFLSKGKAAKNLKVYLNDLSFGKTTGFRIPPIFARFRIVNPSNTPIKVDNIAGDLFVNKNQIASIQNLTPITIAASSEIIYPIKIETSVLSLAQTIYNLIKNKQKISVSFNGSVNSGGILFPINQTILQQ